MRNVGAIIFGRLTFLYNKSMRFPRPSFFGSSVEFNSMCRLSISCNKASAVLNSSMSMPQSFKMSSRNVTTAHSAPKSISVPLMEMTALPRIFVMTVCSMSCKKRMLSR